MFPEELSDLYNTIATGHKQYERDLTISEVRELFKVHNPTITRAKHEVVSDMLTDIHKLPAIGKDVAKDVLQKIWQQEIGRNIADMGLAIMEGSPEKIADVKDL